MRVDLTVRRRDGTEQDVAITAPPGTCLAAVTTALQVVAGTTAPLWSGPHPLRPETRLGGPDLASGAVLSTTQPSARRDELGARLEVVGGNHGGRAVATRGGTLTIGRALHCTLRLDDPRVSRSHARFAVGRSGVTVSDVGSTHGTFVDGERIDGESRAVRSGALVRVGDTFLAMSTHDDPIAAPQPQPDGTRLVNRTCADRPPLDDRVIDLPEPPERRAAQRVAWSMALVPAAAGVVLAATMHSPAFLAIALLSPLAVLLAALGERLGGQRDARRSRAAHRAQTDRVRHEIASALQAEVVRRRAMQPDPPAVLRAATLPTTRLWHRARDDPDLLRVRVGLSDVPSALLVRQIGAIEPAGIVTAVPATVDLGRGPLGVIAPRHVRDGIARWLLAQLAVSCSPADLEIAVLLSPGSGWTWLRWLPHVRDRIACTGREHDILVRELAELAQLRRDTAAHVPWRGSWLLVLVAARPASGIAARLSATLAGAVAIGITALFLPDHAGELPSICKHVVYAVDEIGATVSCGDDRAVADRVDTDWVDAVARALAPLRDAGADPTLALPGESRLTALLDADAESVRARWRHCDGTARLAVGLAADGPLWIDLDGDGPHLLIAGTTGSGKSELLQTLVVGLAAQQPPSEITFLLFDYKGGAAFADCARLPHCVGLVTDLDAHLARRVLVSLDSEIRRREALLATAGTADRAAYRAAGHALPRLMLVVDEFAALADELAGFVPGLVGVAQRGRSLGLHLVLATQRPAGVVSPEIRANVGVRIALRVTSAAESLDVIDAAEAATIDRRTPGRAYVRIGTTLRAVQCARVAGRANSGEIGVAPLDLWRRRLGPIDEADDTDLRRFMTAIAAATEGMPAPRRPWLPPLPKLLDAADLPSAVRDQIPFALADLPTAQRQDPVSIDLSTGAGVLIVGSSRSGRSSALLSIALRAAEQCSPADLVLHAIDGTAGGLNALSTLPQLGTLAAITPDADLAARLLARLEAELVRRRDALAAGKGEPSLLLLVDGWEALCSASEHHDGGRSAERLLTLLGIARSARATIVVTGGRAALSPRVTASADTRFVLHLFDAADYALAGIEPPASRLTPVPGRAIRVADGAEIQFAHPGDSAQQQHRAAACAARWPDPAAPRLRLRRLPTTVRLADLPSAHCTLGVGGDEARPVVIDLATGTGRLLIAGPPRSGRSTLLRLIAVQSRSPDVLVAARRRSPLAQLARQQVLDPADEPGELPQRGLLLVDDAEEFTDTPVGAALLAWLHAGDPERCAVVAGRSDAMAVSFRGLTAELRQARCGVLLQPGPLDGELLGVSLPRTRVAELPGRGVLVPDPQWRLGAVPLPIQVALP
jgi:S-DNA-T family DNA segregation ATPase FtsK/SpoIIIE